LLAGCSLATLPERRAGPAAHGGGVNRMQAPEQQAAVPLRAGQPWLVADIGGTNARFGWVAAGEDRVSHVVKLPVADHAGPASAARAYLAGLAAQIGAAAAVPHKAALAVATAVHDDVIELTNSHWQFSRRALAQELGLDALLMLNDFEALALSLPRLQPQQLRPHGALPSGRGTLAVIGPGTGLGVGGVIETARGWFALPGEGGHATLAPMDDFESELLAAVRTEHPHVSAERLLSGIGLPTLLAGVARVSGLAVPALTAEAIVDGGVAGTDALARRTLDVFCGLLGGFAGNVALTLGARGGVYIGGGIVPRLGELFFASAFRERFEAKGRFRPYLETIPTALITDTLAALAGAAFALEQHGRA
jgi:glucokinase